MIKETQTTAAMTPDQTAFLEELVDDYSISMRDMERQLNEARGGQDILSGRIPDLRMDNDEIAAWMGMDATLAEAPKIKRLRQILAEDVATMSSTEIFEQRQALADFRRKNTAESA